MCYFIQTGRTMTKQIGQLLNVIPCSLLHLNNYSVRTFLECFDPKIDLNQSCITLKSKNKTNNGLNWNVYSTIHERNPLRQGIYTFPMLETTNDWLCQLFFPVNRVIFRDNAYVR